MSKKVKCFGADEKIRAIADKFVKMGYTHGLSTVFTDYLTLTSCAVSNSVDKLHYDERESLYNKTIGKYSNDERRQIFEIHNKS